ncbi:MAG: class I SAM-dependent rRNA methyltransferase [Spirochaetes bacterium]|nr:MAG: class I SAM-dependent rRNA methyltransferase [Spirochaetota bacterium]
MNAIVLKKGKEKPVRNRHPWIFSGAISRLEGKISDGEIIAVLDAQSALLGYGYYNSKSQICVRMLSFGSREIDRDFLALLVRNAVARRRTLPFHADTDALRLINAEGDSLPGLVLDDYAGHMVVQFMTLGMDRLRDDILSIIGAQLQPSSIYERSDHAGRGLEGLSERTGQVSGTTPDDIVITERGMKFHVDVKRGQKTGFFLDQRDNRALVRSLARGRRVLNLFAYTGGFAVAALAGGASQVISLDSSADALRMLARNIEDNGFPAQEAIAADAFLFLRERSIESNLIIIDPPSFTKSRNAVDSACRGYKELNLQAIRKCPSGALLLTCSCSRYVGMDLFQKIVFGAAADAGRNAVMLSALHHPADHPVSLFHPEGHYLKSLLIHVD